MALWNATAMKSRGGVLRLFCEVVLIAVVSELLIAFTLGRIWGGSNTTSAFLHALLLMAVVAPLFVWRCIALTRREANRLDATYDIPRWVLALTTGVFVLGLGVALAFAHWQHTRIEAEARQRFDRQMEVLAGEIQRRFLQPIYGMKGARGVYAASPVVNREAFRAYVASRDLAVEFPGVRGFAMVQRVMRQDIDAFVAAEKADGMPDFAVRSSGNAPDLYVVKYIEPVVSNAGAIGFDLGGEPLRRAALEQAIRTGLPTLSNRVVLVQDEQKGAGFLYFLPVYRAGVPLNTAQQRFDGLVGVLASPIVARELLAGTVRAVASQLDFDLYEGAIHPEDLVYSHRTDSPAAAATPSPALVRPSAWLREERELVVGERPFVLSARTSAQFEATVDFTTPIVTRIGGSLLSALLALTVWLLGSSRTRAYAVAQRMTADLARLAEVARLTSNSVVITDQAQRVTWVNDGFTRQYGYTPEEAQGRQVQELTGLAGNDPAALQRIEQAVVSGQGCQVEVIHHARDGQSRWMQLEIQPRRNEAGELVGFMQIGLDISERKRAKEQIQQANEALQNILDNLPCGLSVYDRNLKLVAYNQQFRDLTGLPDTLFENPDLGFEEIIRFMATRRDYGSGDVETSVASAIARVRAPEKRIYERLRFDGLPLEVRGVPMPDGGFVNTYVDISERRKTDRLKSEFISTVSHELRTPLAAIYGSLKLLAGGVAGTLPAPAQNLLGVSIRNSERLVKLINDILDLEKLQAGSMKLDRSDLPLRPVLEHAMESTRPYGEPYQVSFEMVPWDGEAVVNMDPDRITQVVVNLLSNAAKFSKPGGVVRVEVSRRDSHVRVSVIDQGEGIPDEFRERIFSRFSQADGSDTRQKGGTGLGLSICKSLVEQHGGRIDYRSEVGKGTEFYFELPLVL
ncbi:CHASE domain-containing protein [Polaromonas sp. YR568]|uniref:CHASE domain-containing protein n=1 Tax=Polaromonas sp. YR568 TaxID=1855301 RepID=UPI0031379ADB